MRRREKHLAGIGLATLALVALAACASGAAGPSAPAAVPPAARAAPGAEATTPARRGAAALGAAGAEAASAAPPALVKVPAAYTAASGAQMAMLVAQHAGLFRERGLDVDLTLLSGDRGIQSLIAGQIAFASYAGVQTVYAVAAGAPIVTVAQDMESVGMAIHAAPAIRDLRGLRGKRLGISAPGTLTDLIARVAAREADLRVGEDLALVGIGSMEDLVPALVSGAIDGAVLSMPGSLRARDAGFPELLDAATLGRSGRLLHTALASRRDYLDQEPDTAQRFVDAYVAAVRRSREDPATAQAALREWLKIEDPQLAEATYQFYVRLLKDPPVPSAEAWQALLDVLADVPGVNPAVHTLAPETLIDTRFVRG